MSKVFKAVAKVAGIVATVAQFVPGLQPIAAIAGGVAAISGTLAAITAKPPRARGSTSNTVIGGNLPIPYVMGRTYAGGNLIHDVGYGGKVGKVQNPYRTLTSVFSGCGPIDSFESFQGDFTAFTFAGNDATGYYGGFLFKSTQLGASPEGAALSAQWAGEPGWSAAHKLSGFAAVKYSLKFDRDGKVFAGGIPQLGAILKGVRVYDPRLDSSYPGGSGAQRITNEATWGWSDNPALHALAYAYGRMQNGKRVFGVQLGGAAIDLATIVAWANVCTANGWKVGGTIYEPGDRWNNLKLICAAGGGEPCFSGGVLTFKYDAPHVSLDTIRIDDLAEGEAVVPGMRTYRARLNGIVPKYRSEAHRWDFVQSELVTIASYLAEDGEEKNEEIQWDLVQGKDQAAQLAAYRLVNGREFGPVTLVCKPRLIEYRIGDCLIIDLPLLGLTAQPCVITAREVNAEAGTVTFDLVSETASKHAFALGKTGTAPPTPALRAPADADQVAFVGGGLFSNTDPVPPVELPSNTMWISPTRRQFLFVGRELNVGGTQLLVGGQPLNVSGYIDVQDDAIGAAAASAAVANADLANIASDGLLTPDEKPRVILDRDVILAEQAGIDAQATAYGIAAEKTVYDAAVSALTAYLATLTGPVAWDILAGNTAIVGATFRAKFGDVYAARQALLNKISDTLKDVEPGADVTANAKVSVELPMAEKRVSADYTGAVTATNRAALIWTPRVTKGGVSKKLDNTTGYTLSETFGGTFAVSNSNGAADKGNITISAIASNKAGGSLTITVDGVAEPRIAFSVEKDIAPPPPGAGSSASMLSWTSPELIGISATSYAAIVPVKTVALASGQTIYGTAAIDYYPSGGGFATRTMTFKWQYSAAGANVWNDFAAGVTGSISDALVDFGEPIGYAGPFPGSVSVVQSKSGLAAGNYDIRLVGLCSAAGLTMILAGAASLVAKP